MSQTIRPSASRQDQRNPIALAVGMMCACSARTDCQCAYRKANDMSYWRKNEGRIFIDTTAHGVLAVAALRGLTGWDYIEARCFLAELGVTSEEATQTLKRITDKTPDGPDGVFEAAEVENFLEHVRSMNRSAADDSPAEAG